MSRVPGNKSFFPIDNLSIWTAVRRGSRDIAEKLRAADEYGVPGVRPRSIQPGEVWIWCYVDEVLGELES
jgi:hypothetical protein